MSSQLKVLLTGPSGRVGPHLIAPFHERYELSLFDLQPLAPSLLTEARFSNSQPCVHLGSIQDGEALRRAMRGVDAVVHLAATSDEAPFREQLLPNNIEGLYNVLDAAQGEGVRRVVFASSVQAVWSGREQNTPLETDVFAPSTMYGVTKIFGEMAGKWFHHKHGLEFVALRIGWFQPRENVHPGRRVNNIWLSPGDAVRLFCLALETPDVGFACVNGTSRTPVEVLSLASARERLGYEPLDSPPLTDAP